MKRNYLKTILTLFTLAAIFSGAAAAANAQTSTAQLQYRRAMDFDGDGKADLTVNREPSNSGSLYWYTRNSSNGQLRAVQWGFREGYVKGRPLGDIVAPGDYDGDGKADYAVVRFTATNLVWYILLSNGGTRAVQFGYNNGSDKLVAADYDGDGKTDVAVARRAANNSGYTWYWVRSLDGAVGSKFVAGHTDSGTFLNCEPIQGDYDGDAKADFTQFCTYGGIVPKPTFFKTMSSLNGTATVTQWGAGILYPSYYTTDIPVPGDYDGDGKTDVAVVRLQPTNGVYYYYWYIRRSTDGGLTARQFGADGSQHSLIPADYDGDGKTDLAVWATDTGITSIQQSLNSQIINIQWGGNNNTGGSFSDTFLKFNGYNYH